eukprot:296674-Rhodomonas_salina.1
MPQAVTMIAMRLSAAMGTRLSSSSSSHPRAIPCHHQLLRSSSSSSSVWSNEHVACSARPATRCDHGRNYIVSCA